MRKIIAVLLVFIVICLGIFSGCTEENVPTNQETLDKTNIIGAWVNVTLLINQSGVNRSTMRVYNFTDNRFNLTAYFLIGLESYRQFTEGTYELKEGNIIFTNATMIPPLKYTFSYSFNANYSTLTLTNSSGIYLVFWKSSN